MAAIEMLYFAWVREAIGTGAETVTPPEGVATLGDLVGWLSGRSPGHATAFAEPHRLRAAIDQDFVDFAAPIAGAREIALFPPVTGG
ncbi:MULTISPECIES: molybdopterin converting factor subunit 1 [Sphingomonadales]|uniref:Molybdopterin synthase small subunit n=1 Tax=Edaphosphingomonas haloaromaticamans TaxID=653954 RepID=A0A1S1H9Y8_9SPHN|nr:MULTISPECIES: molybdopterin converting factor subunit 1 [Sphingomonas]AGH50493.1 molybdopterin converting factor subunit 1 [Sphingomonas sp. MM-1]MDX3886131.1 molybdopterin converting factor subunit 1 [Sphingomonas sp.]OHT18927.1 molybdopterin synthase small subunit [Sphingomonas haloaromaticamans]